VEKRGRKTVKVSSKGWVVLPASLRRKYGIKAGTLIDIVEENNKIKLIPVTKNPVQACYGKYAEHPSLLKELREEREKEKEREEKKTLRY